VGAIATGAVAVGFAAASDFAQHLFHTVSERQPLLAWVLPPLGFATVAALTTRYFAEARGSGIPQTIASLHLAAGPVRDRLLSLRNAAAKFVLTIVALACGASIGREGPTVQIGASIMYTLGRIVRLPAAGLHRGLILAGGAAGVAAAFNTPLAGVVFAIEELSRSFEQRSSGLIFTAVIIAGLTSVALVGNYAYFGSTRVTLEAAGEWGVMPVCGLLGGLLGGGFARCMLLMRREIPALMRRWPLLTPVRLAFVCGALVAVLGWSSNGMTFGTGYEEARQLLQQDGGPGTAFALQKFLATLISYAAGIPAGVFAPSLAVGAGLGGVISSYLHAAPAGAIVVMTMAAYFAGVVQAPLTALVIVSEMIGDRALTLPIMASALLGRGASALVCREGLYQSLAHSFMTPQRES
jgi:H+/Cl- antiporter ClcA